MTDTDPTLPPRQPNTPRVLLRRAWAWCRAHPEHALRGAIFAAGVVLGAVLW